MGSSVISFNEKSILVENHQNEKTECVVFLQDSEQQDDEHSLCLYKSYNYVLITKDNVHLKKFGVDELIHFIFWQPPKKIIS